MSGTIFSAKTGAAISAAIAIPPGEALSILITGTSFSASVEGTLDPDSINWIPIGTITTPGLTTFPPGPAKFRLNLASGTAVSAQYSSTRVSTINQQSAAGPDYSGAISTAQGNASAALTAAQAALNSLGNTTLASLSTKAQSAGAQFVDGSRWLWAASGTVDGGTVVAASGSGVWKRELAPGQPITPRMFGAVEDGVADDRAALQACIYTANLLKYDVLLNPSATYLLKSFTYAANKVLLYVYGNTRISGKGLIKVDSSVGPYKAIFEQGEFLTDLRVRDIRIDCGNYVLAAPNALNAPVDPGQESDPRRVFNLASGTSASFIGMQILNWTGVHCFATNLIDTIVIDKNKVLNAGVGYNGQDFDSSLVYCNGVTQTITNNTFVSGNALGTRTCLEIHGKSSIVYGNTIRRFKASFIVASDLAQGAIESAIITNNQCYEVMVGLYPWAVGGKIKTLTFSDNTITIDRSLGGLPSASGGLLFWTLNTYPIGVLNFSNNTIEFLAAGASFLADDDTDGVMVNGNQQVIDRLEVYGNTILNGPAHGISIRFAKIGSGLIGPNTVNNTGSYTSLTNRAGVYLVGNTYNGDFLVKGNTLVDTRGTTLMTHGVLHYGVANDNASNVRIVENTVSYTGTAGATVAVNTTAPLMQQKAYSIPRPGVGPAFAGNFAEGSTVEDTSGGTIYRQSTAGSGSRWIVQRSEKLPTDGNFGYQGDRHTNPSPTAGGSAGLVCVSDGVSAQTPFPLSSAVSLGQFYSANGKTYYISASGTTSATAPVHTSGTVTNGTASVQWFGANAVYKTLSTIAP